MCKLGFAVAGRKGKSMGENIITNKKKETLKINSCKNITIDVAECEEITVNVNDSRKFDINIVDCKNYSIHTREKREGANKEQAGQHIGYADESALASAT